MSVNDLIGVEIGGTLGEMIKDDRRSHDDESHNVQSPNKTSGYYASKDYQIESLTTIGREGLHINLLQTEGTHNSDKDVNKSLELEDNS